jgi:hypothetical protein
MVRTLWSIEIIRGRCVEEHYVIITHKAKVTGCFTTHLSLFMDILKNSVVILPLHVKAFMKFSCLENPTFVPESILLLFCK